MNLYGWFPCAECGVERRVAIRRGEPVSKRCRPCGLKHRHKTAAGGMLWPTGKLADPPDMTPRQAWLSLVAGEITADEFGAVLAAWDR